MTIQIKKIVKMRYLKTTIGKKREFYEFLGLQTSTQEI